jgi:hypothetical protein
MSRRLCIAACACALATLAAPPALAAPQYLKDYTHAYNVAKKAGHDVGRNIRRFGYRTKHGVRPARKTEVTASTAVLRRMVAPPVVAVPSAPATTSNAASSQTAGSSSGAAGLPACASESGTNYSMGPDNTNPSGASGRYQIMPFHWSTDCAGLAQDPAGQDKCASIIYKNSGSSAWTNCGG